MPPRMPPKKPEAPKANVFVEVTVILLIIFFVGLVWVRLQAYLQYTGGTSLWSAIVAFFLSIYPFIVGLAAVVTASAIFGIVYNLRKIAAITEEENKIYNPDPELASQVVKQAKNPRWDKIVDQSNSANPADWRQAIIDADVMLEELLQAQNYHGDGVGEMLKAVDKSDFLTLDAAWDAHKVRNQIAHAGPDFDLTERETKRVIAEFEAVFREFEVI